mmetsp:Transcript_118571/g.185141  ORF Transcript_118571/g.185141 Transcript_118571/m.185141 type:complete len:198 (+) Transcript_118571:85-678(+)
MDIASARSSSFGSVDYERRDSRAATPSRSRPAGLNFSKRTVERVGFNTQGLADNQSREVLRTLTAHCLLGTTDHKYLRGREASRSLHEAQEAAPAGFPAPFSAFSRTLSNSALPKPRPNEMALRSLKPSEAYTAFQDLQGRHLLPPAGCLSEAANRKKVNNFSCVEYNFLADQATPERPHDQKIAFMMSAHRDRVPC